MPIDPFAALSAMVRAEAARTETTHTVEPTERRRPPETESEPRPDARRSRTDDRTDDRTV
ncbi:hypothetical protein [Streptomyces sp. NPDC008141]|uniref:hypothetical protein n=1 Tax=Streptomyces sp. NPDC008141 TaxID=3364815 RepID=UPI0036E4C1A4